MNPNNRGGLRPSGPFPYKWALNNSLKVFTSSLLMWNFFEMGARASAQFPVNPQLPRINSYFCLDVPTAKWKYSTVELPVHSITASSDILCLWKRCFSYKYQINTNRLEENARNRFTGRATTMRKCRALKGEQNASVSSFMKDLT